MGGSKNDKTFLIVYQRTKVQKIHSSKNEGVEKI
jgi:hypothetical protein